MIRNSCLLALALLVGLSPGPRPARADDAQLKDTLEKLFAAAWGPEDRALSKPERVQRERVVRVYSRQLRDVAPDDPRVNFALMLVALKRDQLEAAAKFYGDLPEAVRNRPLILKCKMWTSLKSGATADCLAEMQRLVELLPPEDAAGNAETEHRRTALFLGGCCGYLAGPARALQPEDEQQITARLTPTRRAAFDEARRDVLDRFAELADQCRAARDAARDAEHQRRLAELAELAGRLEATETQLAQREQGLEQATRETSSELGRLDAQLRDLDHRGRIVETRRLTLLQEFDVLRARILDLRHAAEHPELKPYERQRLLNSAIAVELRLNRNAGDQAELEGERQRVLTEASRLIQRKNELAARVGQERARLAAAQQGVAALSRQEQQLRAAPITGDTPEVLALERPLALPETYVPVSLDPGRDLVLQAFPQEEAE